MSTMLQDTTATRNSKLISPLAALYNSVYEGYAACDGSALKHFHDLPTMRPNGSAYGSFRLNFVAVF